MKLYPVLLMFTGSALLFSCGEKDEPPVDHDPEDTIAKYDPVETEEPNTGYAPAFEGQTRTFGIKTETPLALDVITSGLSGPWSVNVLPDNNFIITEKAGNIVVLSPDGTVLNRISEGLPDIDSRGQGGLLELLLDSNFATNNTIYFSFTHRISSGENTLAVAKGQLNRTSDRIDDVEIIYSVHPAYSNTLHFGSRLLFDQEGYILLCAGERSDASMRTYAQELNSGLGKVLRFSVDGEPHPENPFAGDGEHAQYVYSYGHRNPQGMVMDRSSGKIYAVEHGPRGGDEINLIEKGKNYGWPVITYGIEYSGGAVGSGITQQAGMEQPLYYWDPSISPAGMVMYDSDYIPEWKGNLIIGCLSGQHIVRIRFFNGNVAGEERLFESEGERFRDIVQTGDGLIWAVTDSGKLCRISKS